MTLEWMTRSGATKKPGLVFHTDPSKMEGMFKVGHFTQGKMKRKFGMGGNAFKCFPYIVLYKKRLDHNGSLETSGGARGGLGGATAPESPSEVSSPPVGGNFGFSSEEIGQSNARKHNFSVIGAPPVASSSPSVGKFLAPSLLETIVVMS